MKNLNIIKKLGLPLATALSLVMVTQVDTFAHPAKNSTDDRIHFLDTGKGGDAIIIESNGRFAMVDSGESTPQNVETIKKYLKDIGADHLDYFIATHIHSDHIGNIASLIDSGIKVENIIATEIPRISYNTKDSQLPNNKNNPLAGYVAPIEYMDAKHNGVMQDDWKSDILYRDMLKSFYAQYDKKGSITDLKHFKGGEGYQLRPTENAELVFGDYKLKFNNAFSGYLGDYNIPKNVKVTAEQDTNASSLFISVIDNAGFKFYLSGDGRAENIEQLFDNSTKQNQNGPKMDNMYKNVAGYKLSHHGTNDSATFINKLHDNNKNIKMFVMGANPGYRGSDHVINRNIPLYVTNPYNDTYNGHIAVDFSNGSVATYDIPAKSKAQSKGESISSNYAWEKKNNEWYLKLNNKDYVKNKWAIVEGQHYYFDKNGRALKNGWHMINNTWYYFAKAGETDIYGKSYPECARFTNSWAKDGNDWYYLDANGEMATNRWVREFKDGNAQWFRLGEDGKMLRGKHTIGNQTYYFAPKSGHTAYSGQKYADGQMYENEWLKLSNGSWNYFKKDGYMAKNEALIIDGVRYKFNYNGTY